MVIPNKSYSQEECLYRNKCIKHRRICEYYRIQPTNVNNLTELINLIKLFEDDVTNIEIVNKRKILWSYMKELQSDDYTKQFVFFDVYYDDLH